MKRRLVLFFCIASQIISSCLVICSSSLIKINNKITPSMLQQCGIDPMFTILVEGKILEQNSSIEIPLKGSQLKAAYKYNFLNGTYKGGNEITFELSNYKIPQELNLLFSWKDKYRLILQGAQPKQKKSLKS